MQPAVEVVLVGDSSASLQHGRLWRHVIFVASKRARRLVVFQSEASPQPAESLAAGVRPIYTNLLVTSQYLQLLNGVSCDTGFFFAPITCTSKKAATVSPTLSLSASILLVESLLRGRFV